jgi:hypothetical protein
LRFYECYPQSVAIEGSVFGEFCSQLAVFSSAEDRWREITRDDMRGWVVEPVAAGSAFLVMAHSPEVSYEGDQVFETRMLAYVPHQPGTGVENPEPFVPSTEIVGGEVRMPITFPDGSSATVVYSTSLDLAALGVQPDVSYLWRDDPPPRFPIIFLHDRNASIAEFVDGTEPVGIVNSYRSIEIWRMSEAWSERRQLLQGHWLRYGLRSWTVLVALDHPGQAEEVATSLLIRETGGGFPVAEASGPIALSQESGEGEGSLLTIGPSLDPSVVLWLDRCAGGDHGIEASGEYASKCVGDGRISAGIYGDPVTVAAIFEGLRVEDFRQA